MKINTLTIKKIIKEELDSVIKEFKIPDIIPTPESMGFKRVVIDPSFESKAKEILSNVDVKGLREFLKQNFPMDKLRLKESIEKNLPQRKRTAGEIITENVRIMKADRMWQENFDQNIQELIQISKEDPSQKELIDEWVKIFVFEKSKTWFDKNTPTIKEFVRNNYESLKDFFKDFFKVSAALMVGLPFLMFPFFVAIIAVFLLETGMEIVTWGDWERGMNIDRITSHIFILVMDLLPEIPKIGLFLVMLRRVLGPREKNNEND